MPTTSQPLGADGVQALSALALTRTFRTGTSPVHAVDDVHLHLRRGALTAVVGPSGSGKSTLLQLLAGLDAPTSGRVVVDGVDITGLDDDALTRVRAQRMGFIFQAFHLFADLTVAENVDLPASLADGGLLVDPAWREHLLDVLGLGDLLARRPVELSGGEQQRVAVARALAHRPAVLFADEPTGNLDVATSRRVMDLLRELVDVDAVTVVLVTHDPVAASHADRVVVMSDGRVTADLGPTGALELAGRLLGEVDGAHHR